MGASRHGHSRVVELLLQHTDTDPEVVDRWAGHVTRDSCDTRDPCRDGHSALHHARTNSVKWRLHNFSRRSRSVDNVMGAQQRWISCR